MKATKQKAITETKTVEIEPEKIIFELTRQEAETLGALFGCITAEDIRKILDVHPDLTDSYFPNRMDAYDTTYFTGGAYKQISNALGQ